MVQSEVADLRQQLATTYLSAKLGLSGFASGTSRHRFISYRMQQMGSTFTTLADLIGSQDEAIQMAVETLQEVPDTATRHNILTVLVHELGDTEATQHLLDWVNDLWETTDLLIQRFGLEVTRKIIDAPVSLPVQEVMES